MVPDQSEPRGRLGQNVAIHTVALVLLALATMTVVHESPLESEQVLLSRGGTIHPGGVPSTLKATDEDLFDMLTSPDEQPTTAQTYELKQPEMPTATIPQMEFTTPPAVRQCVNRGPPACKTSTPMCMKQGPVCTYKKVCIAKSKKCSPSGICAQPGKQCNYAFSKQCVACAKTTSTCQSAHTVASTCVPKCRKTCMKDAVCETRCAEGCLSRYTAFIGQCKKDCATCQEGAVKQVCWDTCNSWKSCANSASKCSKVSVCDKKGQQCAFLKTCVKKRKQCSPVKTCVRSKNLCKKTSHCVRRDTKCTHLEVPACLSCQTNSTACKGMKRVKQLCYQDCNIHCKKAKPRFRQKCHSSCTAGCHASEAALRKLCHTKCPACEHMSSGCHLKCLQKETKQACKKVCKKHVTTQQCQMVCSKEKLKKKCTSVCSKWTPRDHCKKTCSKWTFSPQRPCLHGCRTHGWQRVCSNKKMQCTQWKGGKVCDKEGPCLQYKEAPVFPLAPGPVITAPHPAGQVMPPTTRASGISPPVKATKLGQNGLQVGAVPPVSPSTKLGRVMQKATYDVFRLLSPAANDFK